MSTPTEKLMLLLASSEMSKKEIERALKQFSVFPPYKIALHIQELRYRIKQEISMNSQYFTWDSPAEYQRKRVRQYDSIRKIRPLNISSTVSRVEAILRGEANLSVLDSVNAIISCAKKTGVETSSLSQFQKKTGLSRWLTTLESKIGGKKLLQLATMARNDAVHDEKSDWPLKEN